MNILKSSVLSGLAVGAVLGVTLLVTSPSAVAQTATQPEQPQAQATIYRYVAQPGDSYSVLARKAVQTYGLANKVNLSEAQIIAAETNLTLDAGSPLLIKGQKVTLQESDVKEWVEKAEKLSAQQQTLWQPYTIGVDFDTRTNGE